MPFSLAISSRVDLYSSGSCKVMGLPGMGRMFSLLEGLGFALEVQCKRRKTSLMEFEYREKNKKATKNQGIKEV